MCGGFEITHLFIVHADSDKPRLAPILRRLLDANIGIWIDDPTHPDLRLGAQDRAKVSGHMRSGPNWKRQRDDAMAAAGAILVIVSRQSVGAKRPEVQAELSIAEFCEMDKGIPVLVAGLTNTELKRGTDLIGLRSGFKTFVENRGNRYVLTDHGERAVAALIETFLAERIHGNRKLRKAAPRPKPSPMEEASPFFANRDRQNLDIAHAIRAARDLDGALKPLPVLVGTKPDHPDTFALEALTLRLLPDLFGSSAWEPIELTWLEDALSNPSAQLALMLEELGDRKPFPKCSVPYAMPRVEHLCESHSQKRVLELWSELWATYSPPNDNCQLLPILDIRADPVRALHRIAGRLGMKRRSVAKFATKLELCAAAVQVANERVELIPIAPFGLVTWGCVERWLRKEVDGLVRRPHLVSFSSSLYAEFQNGGLTMEAWYRVATEKFEALDKTPATGQFRVMVR